MTDDTHSTAAGSTAYVFTANDGAMVYYRGDDLGGATSGAQHTDHVDPDIRLDISKALSRS